ncbi:uncharacterized protein LOC108681062 isoform X3 [Hyalella azteca]|nr:uncharacterized protein LOC108681062 isoform X3 [Hyalella azteca]
MLYRSMHRSVAWYQRLERVRLNETVPLPTRLAWCRLDMSCQPNRSKQRAANHYFLLSITIFLILFTPLGMSLKKLKQRHGVGSNAISSRNPSAVRVNGDDAEENEVTPKETHKIPAVTTINEENNITDSLAVTLELMPCINLNPDPQINMQPDFEVADSNTAIFQRSKSELGTLTDKTDSKLSNGVSESCFNKENSVKAIMSFIEKLSPVESSYDVDVNDNEPREKDSSSKLGYVTNVNIDGREQLMKECIENVESSGCFQMNDRDGKIKGKGISSSKGYYKALSLTAAGCVVGLLLRLYRHGSFEASCLSAAKEQARRLLFRLDDFLATQGNLTTLAKQMVFLSMCDKCLLPGQNLASLYTLMFCSIVTYCIDYAEGLLTRQQWSLSVRIGGPTSSVRHLALSTTNIVLEWTKAVTFMTTFVFLLLMLGLEKGLNNYSPNAAYIFFSSMYWITTEKICRKYVLHFMVEKKFRFWDSLEELYVPLLLQLLQLCSMGLFIVPCLYLGYWRLSIAGLVFARADFMKCRSLQLKHSAHLSELSAFRRAEETELREHNDRCSVCLSCMTSARVTSCRHFYHAECLLRIVRASQGRGRCPLCQAPLI